jgi:hypothetical protein
MRTREVKMFDGQVACPYLHGGSVDVETCYRCRRLRAFYDEESGTKVVCAGPLRVRRLARGREAGVMNVQELMSRQDTASTAGEAILTVGRRPSSCDRERVSP